LMDYVLFDQCRDPFAEENSASIENRPLARCYWELRPLSIFAYSNTINNLGRICSTRRLIYSLGSRLRLFETERKNQQCRFKVIAGFGNRHSSTE
jgi:hypothetical protein